MKGTWSGYMKRVRRGWLLRSKSLKKNLDIMRRGGGRIGKSNSRSGLVFVKSSADCGQAPRGHDPTTAMTVTTC